MYDPARDFESSDKLNLSLVSCAGSPVKHCYRLSRMGGRQRIILDWWGGLQNWWSKCSCPHNQGKDGMCPWIMLHLCYFYALLSSTYIFASEQNPAILSWISGLECSSNITWFIVLMLSSVLGTAQLYLHTY
jgi:hypothetical protein